LLLLLDLKGFRDQLDHKVRVVEVELVPVVKDRPVHKDLKVRLVGELVLALKGRLDHKDFREIKAHKVELDHKDFKGIKDLQDLRGFKVQLETKV
jgi:hypothetical protein